VPDRIEGATLVYELLARADGTYARLLGRLACVAAPLIDNFAFLPVADAERRDPLEILEGRCRVPLVMALPL
jgi:hypothetical protein